MRYILIVFSIFIVIVTANPAYCDWEEMIQVNTDNYGKQAPRGWVDCPWPIASDDNGNVYTVWEDKRDPAEDPELNIYFRKKNADGSWEQEDYRVSYEQGRLYGHPSICVLPGEYPPKLLACYVAEDYSIRELRGNTFDGEEWGDPSYFISDDGDNLLTFSSPGWGTNIVALSNGKAYAIWQYIVDDDVELWFNEYDEGWTAENEKAVYDDAGSNDHYSRYHNACVDDEDNIHLFYSDDKSGHFEIYYLSKKPEDEDFGEFPGYHVSITPENVDSKFPYCAISYVADTTFLHVVWSTEPTNIIYYRNWNSITSSWSDIIDTISYDIIPANEKPSVACDSYGNVHVVWEVETDVDSYDLVKYRKFDYGTGEWGTIVTLPADEEVIEKYGMPVIISDVFDNLHVLMTGERVGAEENDEEAYYSFFDAPPHPPQHPTQVFSGRPKDITITWDANDEYDLDGYMIIRRYVEKPGLDTLATVDDTITTYVDTEIPHPIGESTNYVRYWIEAIDTAGQHSPKSDSLQCAVPNGWEPPKLVADGSIPTHFELTGNYPNPFNASTEIRYALPFNAHVTLEIYDVLGRKTATLIDEYQDAGYKTVRWNGRDTYGNEVSSGLYLYRLSSAGLAQSKRMIMLK